MIVKQEVCVFLGRTHAIIGVVIWCFFPTLNLPFLLLGSLFPDADKKGSAMGRILPLWFLGFKHRGMTHKFWFVILLSWIIEFYWIKGVGWSFLIGCVSHIIGDVVSKHKT